MSLKYQVIKILDKHLLFRSIPDNFWKEKYDRKKVSQSAFQPYGGSVSVNCDEFIDPKDCIDMEKKKGKTQKFRVAKLKTGEIRAHPSSFKVNHKPLPDIENPLDDNEAHSEIKLKDNKPLSKSKTLKYYAKLADIASFIPGLEY
ncbi:hypothetical protein [Candidatus Lokiarchaeum ossiferum]|uniref:hypothetical protein n=1 Tax=Candidatus Lokiarchaeum ossiferum TaxID=2951803 RepID=UPI00352D03F3